MLSKEEDKRTPQGHIIRRNNATVVVSGNAKSMPPTKYLNDNERYADR